MTDDAFGAQWLLSDDYAVGNNAYTHFMTPNSLSCIGTGAFGVSDTSWGGIGAAITATSNHPGGVNVGFSDGSVKFIKDSVGIQPWWASRITQRGRSHQLRRLLKGRTRWGQERVGKQCPSHALCYRPEGELVLYRTIRRIIGTTVLVLLMAGCGGPSSPTDGSGTAKAVVPAPRPGEDVMKEQMLMLQKKRNPPQGARNPQGQMRDASENPRELARAFYGRSPPSG